MNLDLSHARKIATEAALAVSEYLNSGFGCAPIAGEKSDDAADVVTEFDRNSETQIAEILNDFDAGVGFYGEEFGRVGPTDTYWLVDPIDGTGHFVRGLSFATTMISLVHEYKPIVAVINNFVTGELFSAALGQGATRNDQPIRVSNRTLKQGYIGTEVRPLSAKHLELLGSFAKETTALQTINCGWDMSMIALGKLDGRIQVDPWGHEWDYAPGALLVAEAGGKVANLYSDEYVVTNTSFIAATPAVFDGLQELVGRVFQ